MSNPPIKSVDNSAPVKGVIFDLDGTLVTSSLNLSAIRRQIGCPQDVDILRFIEAMADPQQCQSATDEVIQFELDDAQTSEVIEGVVSMLTQLQHWQMPTAVVTRNCKAATQKKLQRHGLSFETVITRECAPAKPDPTSLLQISSDWQISSEHLIYVGDYIYDIHAAKNARMRSVYMHFSEDEPPAWHSEATWCFSNYQHLLEKLEVVNL